MTPTQPFPAVRRAFGRALGLVLLLGAGLAQAQFVWVAPNGTRHYSDQPPPPGTPPSRILKAPGLPAVSLQLASAPAAKAAPETSAAAPAAVPVQPAEKPKGPPTLAEREADFRKRQKEGQEAQAKQEEEARAGAARAEHCVEVRKAKLMFDSGIRVAEVGLDGQKRYLSDAERAQRSARANAMAAECR
ncbi:DUF4124 domain-containing protein [Massilia sp.]|uniref:DUF4124 domain-containing protein n=1 Tax=Massilia sp. TaxID=1882437 RepID=UPI0028AEF199|nr:DUF4124 domain-containing protein [Massilia sp.]